MPKKTPEPFTASRFDGHHLFLTAIHSFRVAFRAAIRSDIVVLDQPYREFDVKIQVLGSSVDRSSGRQFAATYLIDGVVAIDAGCLGLMSSVEEQRAVKHIFLSHSHLDHIASLPIFLDNVYRFGPDCPTIHVSDPVRDSLMRDIFNERVWPDLLRLSSQESPFLRLESLEAEKAKHVEHLRVTPIELSHVIPTLGFLIEAEHSAIAIVSDTSPTERVWQFLRNQPNLKALFLESAFPNSMAWLAEKACHLTPSLFLREYHKLGRRIPVVAVHLKPAFYEEIVGELDDLGLSELIIGQSNSVYEF